MSSNFLRYLRALLILGRVSNLPTVWSNCLAGWWLGGGGNYANLLLLLLGATLLYAGGMFLNDAFDAEFDTQYRRARPIPSGAGFSFMPSTIARSIDTKYSVAARTGATRYSGSEASSPVSRRHEHEPALHGNPI